MFGNKPTNTLIDRWTAVAVEKHIGSAMSTGNVDHAHFNSLISEMLMYREVHQLGTWKVSRMVSVLDRFLSQAVDRGTQKRLLNEARESLM
jgi:hypothetical protein